MICVTPSGAGELQEGVIMEISRVVVAIAAALVPCLCQANIESPAGLGQAGTWAWPCQLLDRELRGETLARADDRTAAALCQGVFFGIMAVNYVSPPFLPFCEGDNDSLVDYVEIFLAFMKNHPDAATKKLGIVLIAALGGAHPKSQCAG
jgi:hypothetical protein